MRDGKRTVCKKDGEDGLRFIGFFGTVQGALQRLSTFSMKTSDAEAVEALISAISEHEKRMADLIASVDFDSYRKDNQKEKPVGDLGFLD